MNTDNDLTDPATYYYDADYPSRTLGPYPENFDPIAASQCLAEDVEFFSAAAQACAIDNAVLELCCGTGRISIMLARKGFRVTSVDISSGMLKQFHDKLDKEEPDVRERVELRQQDLIELDLGEQRFQFAFIALNSLAAIPDFDCQRNALKRIAAHMHQGGRLIVDTINPWALDKRGDPTPKPFYTRRNPHNGNLFTRFSMITEFDAHQRQTLYGWYDEMDPDDIVRRRWYSFLWRPVFRHELELMLIEAGFTVESVVGSHRGEAFAIDSAKLIVTAVFEGR